MSILKVNTIQKKDGSAFPLGKIGQVVQSVYSTQLSSTSTSLASTGLSASITPTSTSSKILVTVTQNGCGVSGTSNAGLYLSLRDNADSEIAIISRYFAYPSNSNHLEHSLSICYLHSPNTTSSYSYSTKYGLATGTGTAYVQASSGVSTMTLMEVLA